MNIFFSGAKKSDFIKISFISYAKIFYKKVVKLSSFKNLPKTNLLKIQIKKLAYKIFVRKTKLLITIFLAEIFITSCASIVHESPTIYFSNLSSNPITNIRCDWSGQKVLTLQTLNPGISRSQAFFIKNDDDFFGTISISWTNVDKERIVRDFNLRRKNLPSLGEKGSFNYIQIYFDQYSYEVVSSDAPDLNSKMTRMDNQLREFAENYKMNTGNPNSGSLIRIEKKNIDKVSEWMINKY